MVKLMGHHDAKHGVPARLLAVYDSGYALVQPRNHRKPELVPLARVHAWKSGDRSAA